MFDVINERKELKIGNIITVFKIPNNSREFVLFSIEGIDDNKSSLEVAYLNEDKDGNNYISEIADEGELKKAMEVVKDIIKVTNIQ